MKFSEGALQGNRFIRAYVRLPISDFSQRGDFGREGSGTQTEEVIESLADGMSILQRQAWKVLACTK